MAFDTIAEYQADIKRRFPEGVPWITPYEQFCRVYYNFETIARDYGLSEAKENTRPIRQAPIKPAIPKAVIIPQQTKIETVKGVDL